MGKTAYIFPGQGSQFPGMGKERYDHSPEAKALMEKADAVLGFPLTEIMFEGSPEDLRQTGVTQPAIFVVSVAASLGLKAPDMVAGHSLGEFSALTVAGAMGFEDALRLVSARAEAMQRCCERVPGMMAAVIALPVQLSRKSYDCKKYDYKKYQENGAHDEFPSSFAPSPGFPSRPSSSLFFEILIL